MENTYAVEFRHVSKIYTLDKKTKKHEPAQQFYALKDITLQIPQGEVTGILGSNGSGKSTMSLLLAGISEVSEGELIVRGEQALISINTGLNPQLTGIENIKLKGTLLGLKPKRINSIINRVIDFAEIGDFMYLPVKKYSSGMKSRLGFAINLCLDPDILIVDEALSVGDKAFAKKCLDMMTELKRQGKTIIFISHSLQQVRDFCDTAIWIEGGFLQSYGPVNEICDQYGNYVDEYNALSSAEKKKIRDDKFARRILPPKKHRLWKGFI